ncbi:MAG: SpoIIE family protein phosphatase, partial [Planctomycetes bacterium]|nr:SpoIIE family protein phosphatase [Planctomycetota bacterium]
VGTDGIWETQNQQGQFFGKERFLDILQNADDLSAEQICSNVIDSVTHFVHPASRTDDITLIVVKAL